ncbi:MULTISPECIES: ribosome silencing factor [Gardnerella]|uniref:Ribosomal silencing factor RsfS n=2 Tax=Gardnerella vaginalis TaxID=2702 RepID=A0ABD4ZCL0_GARVA|nr:ribosome silencing factor [Gardnerella vaginalis]CRH72098.1 iojap protein family [Chlamydia trachomatis]ADP39056.1 iojap-like protein [Gardnerella vaginalis ATCC 14019]EPI51364.1 iojap-like protein [Gardnerella vaginalis JCP7672]KOS08793.1 ribosome-associated protein IOJAP [Gardnerella vaginalis]MDK6861116.1 ribosome silencing factor [Gardnerella vaginalis]
MAALESSVNAIRIAAAAADRLKATNIQAFDVSNLLGITDAMLVVSASNERQVLAVSEEIEKDLYLKDNKRKALSREGLELAQWILLDFGDFVIHIMHEEAREFYRLERLWNDCPAIDLQLPEHDESDADGDYVYDAQNGDQESER